MLITTRAGETTQTAAGRVDDDPGPVGRREDEEDDPSPVCGWVDERKQAIVSMGNDFSVFGNLSENMRVATLLGSDASPGCKFITVDTVKDHGARFRRALSLRGDARRVASEPNAGGTSIVSETLSMEHLQRRFAATNVVTEMEVKYWSPIWKKVDFLVTIGGSRIGVSVSRAMGFPTASGFDFEEAKRLIWKKMHGLIIARQGIDEDMSYDRSILHIFCQTQSIATMLQLAFHQHLSDFVGDDTGIVVLLTVADGVPEIFRDDVTILQRALRTAEVN